MLVVMLNATRGDGHIIRAGEPHLSVADAVALHDSHEVRLGVALLHFKLRRGDLVVKDVVDELRREEMISKVGIHHSCLVVVPLPLEAVREDDLPGVQHAQIFHLSNT